VENRASFRVDQFDVGPIVGLRAVALHRKVREDCIRKAHQFKSLVDEVRAEIVPKAGAGTRHFAPANANVGAIAVVVRFVVRDRSEQTILQNFFRAEEAAVPSAILKDGEELALSFGERGEFTRVGESESERLVDDDVFVREQRRFGEWQMGFVGAGDYDETESRSAMSFAPGTSA
jgi:hypothetical protein